MIIKSSRESKNPPLEKHSFLVLSLPKFSLQEGGSDKKGEILLIHFNTISIIVGQIGGFIANADWRMPLLADYAGSHFLESMYKLSFTKFVK